MFILLFFINTAQSQFNIYTEIEGKNITIYQNYQQLTEFTNQDQYQCHPTTIFEEQYDQQNRTFYFENLHLNSLNISIFPLSLKPRDMQLLNVTDQVEQQEIQLNGNSNHSFTIFYQCFQKWAYIELHVRYDKSILNFRYIKICEQNLYFHNYPELLLLLIQSIIVYIASKYGQKRFRFRRIEKKVEEIDELESREAYYRARGMFSPQYSQPEQNLNNGNFSTNQSQQLDPKKRPINYKLKIGIYLTILLLFFIILLYFEQIVIQQIPIFMIYFICFQITITDLLIYIVSSSISPQLNIPLYGNVKLLNLFTYSLAFGYMLCYIEFDQWILCNCNTICLIFQIVRFMKFYNLQQILFVYLFLLPFTIIMQIYLDIHFLPYIQFPNTFYLDNPKLTCSQMEIFSILLSSSLLTFTRYYGKQTRMGLLLFIISFNGFICGLLVQSIINQQNNIIEKISEFIPSIIIFLIINLYCLIRKELFQLYQGISIGLDDRAIQQQYSYELTIDKFKQ